MSLKLVSLSGAANQFISLLVIVFVDHTVLTGFSCCGASLYVASSYLLFVKVFVFLQS